MLKRSRIWQINVHHVLQNKEVSNCKILTTKLSQLQIDYVFPKIMDNFKILYQYFEKMYSGFYCAMCDAEVHPFI